MRISDKIVEQIAHITMWAGSDNYRWKMKNVGWTGWSVNSVREPAPEIGYERKSDHGR